MSAAASTAKTDGQGRSLEARGVPAINEQGTVLDGGTAAAVDADVEAANAGAHVGGNGAERAAAAHPAAARERAARDDRRRDPVLERQVDRADPVAGLIAGPAAVAVGAMELGAELLPAAVAKLPVEGLEAARRVAAGRDPPRLPAVGAEEREPRLMARVASHPRLDLDADDPRLRRGPPGDPSVPSLRRARDRADLK